MAKQVAGSPRRFLWPVLLLAGFLGAIALTETALFTRAPQGMADRPCPPGNGNVHLPLGTDLNRKDSRSRLQDWAELCHYRSANEAAVDRVPAAVFIGDSITSRWQLGKPAFLPAGVINRGISGQTSPQILLRFYPDAVALKPRIVHVMAGYNDIAGNTGPNRPGDFKNNIRAIADIAKANRIALVIGSLTPSKLRRRGIHGNPAPRIVELNRWLQEFARERGLVYANYHAVLVDGEGGMQLRYSRDDLHPNAAGYAAMWPVAEAALVRAAAGEAGTPR